MLGNLDEVLPGKMIGGNIYRNRDRRMPETESRTWYEADFDYSGGYRKITAACCIPTMAWYL